MLKKEQWRNAEISSQKQKNMIEPTLHKWSLNNELIIYIWIGNTGSCEPLVYWDYYGIDLRLSFHSFVYNYCIQIIQKTSCNKNRIWKILKTRFYTKDSRLGKWKEKCTNRWTYRQTDKVKPVIVTVN
jgi:hypothetical protein